MTSSYDGVVAWTAETNDAPEAPLIRCRELVVGYRGKGLLPAVDVSIRRGEFWALIGINGSGKTTFLRTVLGLLPRVGGEIERTAGVVLSYVPQRSELDPQIPGRVVDLVRSGLDRGWSFLHPFGLRADDAVKAALRDARCADLAGDQFSRLSEGQKARALLARALVSNPDVLVLDEPTSAVDAQTERAVFELLESLRDERNLALVVVSHRSELFVDRATHALFIDRNDRVATAGEFGPVTESPAFVLRHGPIAVPVPDARVASMH